MADLLKITAPSLMVTTGVAVVSLGVGYYFGSIKKKNKSRALKSNMNKEDPLMKYISDHSLREPSFLRDLREETQVKTGSQIEMIIDPLEAQFLRLLLKSIGAKRCIEVGTFTGYNACSVALALPDDGEVVACDVSEDFINIGKKFWTEDCVSKIKINIRPAIETLDALIEEGLEGSFDFVFIDADKANYGRYYERALVLIRQGGIIAIDNTLWSGRVLQEKTSFDESTKSISELNYKVRNDKRVDVSMLSLGDGTTLCRKN